MPATISFLYVCSTGGKIRTHDTWFWRPVLYQLSYTRVMTGKGEHLLGIHLRLKFYN